MRPLRTTLLIPLALGLAGCALPPSVSSKTLTDQAISLLAQKDCRLWRLMQGKSICASEASVAAVAALPPALPVRAASPALRPPEPSIPAAAPSTEALALPPEAIPPALAPRPAAAAAAPKPAATGSTSPPAAAAATEGISRQNIAAGSPRRAPAASAARVPAAQPAMPRLAGEARVRGEMIIRSGTDEAEARALADSLRAAGATVRRARRGDITIYEVVMGLSG